MNERSKEAIEQNDDRGDHESDADNDEESGEKAEDGLLLNRFLEGKQKREKKKDDADKAEVGEADLDFGFQRAKG